MVRINDKLYLTITEAENLWSDLSRNLKAKIHQWMARRLFQPEIYYPPRSRKPCLCSIADLVAIAILHWLFASGVNFRSPLTGFGQERPDTGALSAQARFPQTGVRRLIAAFLEDFGFGAHVHACPAINEHGRVARPLMHHITLVQTANLDAHFKRIYELIPELRYVPSVLIDAGALHDEVLKRLGSAG